MALQTILLEEKLWQVDRPRGWQTSPDGWGYAHSQALICPKSNCLKQWCVMAFEEDQNIHPQGAFCPEHGDGRLLLEFGSIDLPLLEALPEELLRRELLLTIKRLESGDGLY